MNTLKSSCVHRRRLAARRYVLVALLCLMFMMSIGAIAFITFMYLNDLSPVQVFADENESIPVWAVDAAVSPSGGLGYEWEQNEVSQSFADFEILPGQKSFADFTFYIPEKAEAYAEFYRENPHLDAETVVWKVNAFLHLPFYSYIRINYDTNPLLVNPSHRLPYGFVPSLLMPVYEGNPHLLATPETVTAFSRMRSSANRSGLDLAVVSAYRAASRQGELFALQSGDGVVARPYHSEHQTGRALDLWGPGGLLDSGGGSPSPTGLWVSQNSHQYGFIIRYTAYNTHITGFISEPWHITYVGLKISVYMHENGILSLEEFVARNPGVGLS